MRYRFWACHILPYARRAGDHSRVEELPVAHDQLLHAGTVASIADAADYFAAAASACPPTYVDSRPRCAADIAKLIGAVADLIAASAGIREMCNVAEEQHAEEAFGRGDILERRLRGSGRPEQNPKHIQDRPFAIATCVVDTSQAVFFLGRAGLEITASSRNCPVPDEGLACGAEVSGIVASFGFVAAYLSAATSECVETYNPKAFCASDILRIPAALAEVGAASAGMASSCVDLSTPSPAPRVVQPMTMTAVQSMDPFEQTKLALLASDQPWAAAGRRLSDLAPGARPRLVSAMDALIEDERAVFWRALGAEGWRRRDVEELIARHPGRGLRLPNATSRDLDAKRRRAEFAAIIADPRR